MFHPDFVLPVCPPRLVVVHSFTPHSETGDERKRKEEEEEEGSAPG